MISSNKNIAKGKADLRALTSSPARVTSVKCLQQQSVARQKSVQTRVRRKNEKTRMKIWKDEKSSLSLPPTAVNNSPCHTDAMDCRRCNMPLMPLQCLRHSPRWFWYICSLYKYKYVMQWIASICLLCLCTTLTTMKKIICTNSEKLSENIQKAKKRKEKEFATLWSYEITGEKLKSITLVLNSPRSQQYSNIADSPSPSVISEFAT